MDDVRWQRAKQVFHEALEKSGPERSRFIAAACGGDRELQAQVEGLLAAHGEAGEFLDSPTGPGADEAAKAAAGLAAAGPPEGPGTRIGPYKLLQVIGEGGMGVVYMAEQEHPIRRRVALKVIKLGMDTKEVIARFEAERQALALMDHPGIAKVLDAGATDSGRPYFVMELVNGMPITEYCDANRSSTRERLELFMDVCRAIHHAHEKGVIHRDIKPSNVLVTLHDGEPVAKVIDFGIAKAMNQPLTEKTLFTAYGEFAGTPAYMSPEQAALGGLEIDRRCDVYALGVLLYELLTGTTPFEPERLRSRAFLEVMRIIREEDPPTPSARLSTLGDRLSEVASQRQVEPHALEKLVRGDLDWIVTRALEKDRRRRYDTAVALADDVARHFRHEPVTARRPSAAYRARKFARRRRGPLVAAGGIAVAVLLGGGIGQVDGIARPDAVEPGPPAARLVFDYQRDSAGAFPLRDGRHELRYSVPHRGYEIVDLRTGRVARRIPADPEHRESILGGELSLDGRSFAVTRWLEGVRFGGGPMELRVFTVGGPEQGRTVYRWDGGPSIWPVGWSPDQRRLWVFEFGGDSSRIASVAVADGSREVLRTLTWRNTTQPPSLSPDGRFVVYHDADGPGEPPDIVVAATDGTRHLRIAHPARDVNPLFTPDGSGIVFLSDRERGRDLWFLPMTDGRPSGEPRAVWRDTGPFGQSEMFAADGTLYYYFAVNSMEIYEADVDLSRGVVGAPRRIPSRSREINSAPAFSPDGRFLAHTRAEGRRVVLRDVETGVEREYPIAGRLIRPTLDFCEDGRSLLVAGYENDRGFVAYRLDLGQGGAEPVPITPLPYTSVLCGVDGSEVLYVGEGEPDEEPAVLRRSLATGEEAIVYQGPGPRLELRRSPDGRRVAALSQHRGGSVQTEGEVRLVVFASDGGDVTAVPGSWTGVHGFMWLPNGRELLVARTSEGEPADPDSPEITFWRVPVGGGAVAEAGRMRLPAFKDAIYGSLHYDIHADGSRIVFQRHAGLVSQVWAIDNLLQFIQSGATAPVRDPLR